MRKWCSLCKCPGPTYKGESSWKCPLVSQICSTCCHHELNAGMGAQDTLKIVKQMTNKTEQQIHAICRTCKHGGRHVGEHEIVEITPGREKEVLVSERRDIERLKWLRGKRKTKPR